MEYYDIMFLHGFKMKSKIVLFILSKSSYASLFEVEL